MAQPTFHLCTTRDQAASVAAHLVFAALRDQAHRPNRPLVLCGGESIQGVLRQLRSMDLDPLWKDTLVLPSDERCVPAGDPDRNDAPLAKALPAPIRVMSLVSKDDPRQPAEILDSPLPWASGIAVLSMADDGHIASLFPHCAHTEESTTGWVRVDSASKAPACRLSLDGPRLGRIGTTILLLYGNRRRALFDAALRPDAAVQDYPTRYLIDGKTRLHVVAVADSVPSSMSASDHIPFMSPTSPTVPVDC